MIIIIVNYGDRNYDISGDDNNDDNDIHDGDSYHGDDISNEKEVESDNHISRKERN